MKQPFNLQRWIDQHRDQLKPPVGNQQLFHQNDDFIVMVVGGPNARKDYHDDRGEELFYQLEGEIVLKIVDDGKFVDVPIGAGEMFLLPAGVLHSPRRPAGSVGLVIERYRQPDERDGFIWFCETCGHRLHQVYLPVSDIVGQLPEVMNAFYASESLRTCTQCGTVMPPP